MFRLRGTPLLLSVTGLGLLLSGCRQHMIYREMYSPRKNYFVPPVEKAVVLPTEKEKKPSTPAGGAVDPTAVPPAIPATPPAMVPGLDAPPPPPAM